MNECLLRSCFPGVRDQVAWSLVHPLSLPPRAANIREEKLSCSDHRGLLDRLVRSVSPVSPSPEYLRRLASLFELSETDLGSLTAELSNFKANLP